MKIQWSRTDTILWGSGIILIILLNTDYRKGEINWGWAMSIIISALGISQIQGYLIPRLMQKAANWSVQRTLGIYVLLNIGVALFASWTALFITGIIKHESIPLKAYAFSSITYIVMTFAFTSVYMIQQMTERWKKSLLQEEQLKQALLKAEYDALKNQVNPHFLFNSLNILSALIPEDPKNAVNLVERLSKVFRYNLQNNDLTAVDLGTELKIVEAYLFIHKMRFSDNLQYDISIPTTDLARQIVPQGLLTLVENAIKHNECSSEKPLHIWITGGANQVVVRNNYQPKNKQFLESTGIGLKNLKSRYELLTKQPIKVEESTQFFEVKIPFV